MGDVKVFGTGVIAGGFYEDVKITGSSKIDGELYCKNLNVLGKMTAISKVVVDNNINASGSVNFNHDVEALKLECSGSVACRGHFTCDDIEVSGKVVLQTISATNIDICGKLDAKEINCEKINVNSRNLNIQTLYATDVFVKPKGIKIPFKKNKANIDYLECTNIDAEVLICDKLYATNIKLGADCEVKYIEYSGKAEINPKAKIGEIIRIEMK